MPRFISAREAADLVTDGSTVASSGFGWAGSPEGLLVALGERYAREAAPRNLTLVYASTQGDSDSRGLDHLARAGMVRRLVGGFFRSTPKLNAMVAANSVEAYNLPQGLVARLYHAIAMRQPYMLSPIGVGTFLDPRLEGGKLNARTQENLIDLARVGGREYLSYRTFPVDYCLLRGTTADERGNISMEDEAVRVEALPLACATRASGGKVIVQVARIAAAHTIPPQQVALPGYMVDAVVLCEQPDLHHQQTLNSGFDPCFCGAMRSPRSAPDSIAPGPRRVVSLRAAREISDDQVLNFGTGMPESVALVLAEQGRKDRVYVTVESGVSGGVPLPQPDFGIAANPDAIIRQDDQFCFYGAGGIDVAFLGFAEADAHGNVNVSRFNGQLVGCGGFVEISHNAKKVVFCGTLTAGGLDVSVSPRGLCVNHEGRHRKMVDHVGQVTFSGRQSISRGQEILYVTERCVFKLTAEGMVLTEVAAGINVREDILCQMDFPPIVSRDIRPMSEECFL